MSFWENLDSEEVFLKGAAAAKSLQSCPALCDPTDGNLLGSALWGILQARILEWVAIAFSVSKVKEDKIEKFYLVIVCVHIRGPAYFQCLWQN